jgi:hypothetical protein
MESVLLSQRINMNNTGNKYGIAGVRKNGEIVAALYMCTDRLMDFNLPLHIQQYNKMEG